MEEKTPFEEGRLVSLAEVKSMLTRAQLEREELTYEQKLALEHSLRFSRLTVDETDKLVADLSKLDYLSPPYVYKVADLCPTDAEDVKSIFSKSRVTIGDAEIQEILDTVLKYYVPE